MNILRSLCIVFLWLEVYALLIAIILFVFDWHIYFLSAYVSIVALKTIQLSGGITWILHHGEMEMRAFQSLEDRYSAKTETEKLEKFIWERLKLKEPRFMLLGILDRRIRTKRWTKLLRYFLFKYTSQSVGGSLILILAAPTAGGWEKFLYLLLGVCLLLNSFLMGVEILIGNALLGRGYSRYFHFGFIEHPEWASNGRERLRELLHFSSLALCTLSVIAAFCCAYYVMFNGFSGLSVAITFSTTIYEHVFSRSLLWLEFFYFATTTFCTVGFGDIQPTSIGSRCLVIFVHFLTFIYVLFLLQTVQSRNDEV